MKVLFLISLFLAASCARDVVDTPAGETLEKLETLVKDSPLLDTLLKEKPLGDSPVAENVVVEKPAAVTETIDEETKDEVRTNERIASGVDGIAGENLDYVQLTIIFYNQMQSCGGILIHPQYVLTTASCVKE
jgi:hypothetical protein